MNRNRNRRYRSTHGRMGTLALALSMVLGLFAGCGKEENMSATSTSDLRKLYSLEVRPRAGVDLTDSPLLIDAGRASGMRNLYREGSALSKRPGWRQIAQVWTPDEEGERQVADIRGLWSLHDAAGSCLVIHAGERLYEADPDTGSWREVEQGEGCRLSDSPSEGFLLGGRLYIIGAGGYFAFGLFGAEGEAVRELRRVADLPDVYIPTTTTDIIDEEAEGRSYRASLDAVNLLTPLRRNTLIGRALTEEEEEYGESLSFLLDTAPDELSDMVVEIETVDEDGKPITYRLITGWQRFGLASVTEVNYFNSRYLVPEGWVQDGLGSYRDAEGNLRGGSLGSIDYDTGRLTLTGAYFDEDGKAVAAFAPTVADTDNITVTFHKTSTVNTIRDVETATFGILFGEDGHADRLFLGGIPDKPNRLIFSEPGDPTYFPDINFFDIGSDATEVIGFSRVSDGVLAVHKAGELQEPTIYYLQGSGSRDADTLRYTVSFSAVAGGRGSPVVSRRACADLFGDPLILTRDGVYAVRIKENLTTAERRLEERSYSVRTLLRGLSEEELSGAVAVVWRDWYLLSLPDGRLLVADSTDTYADGALTDGNTQYEWYIWDGIPALSFALYKDRLIFGGRDGRVYCFSEAGDELVTGKLYADRTETIFDTEDLMLELGTGLLIYSPTLEGIRAGDKIRFDERAALCHTLAEPGEYELDVQTGRVRLRSPDMLADWYEGMLIRMDINGMNREGTYAVADIDRGEGSFSLVNHGGDPIVDYTGLSYSIGSIRLLEPLTERELYVKEVDEETGKVALVAFSGDTEPIVLTYPYDLIRGDFAEGELRGSLFRDEPVVAEWSSRVFELSSDCYAKTLRRMVVTAEPGGSGRVTIGYDVREGQDMIGTPGTGGISPSALSFAEFSFHNFAVSYTRELCRRNVNFLRVFFRSEEAEPCRLLRITIFYTVTGFRRGGM